MKPTNTTNRIHFSDLDAIRFEDLCLSIVFGMHPWQDIRHYGRSGADGGIDIFGIEESDDSTIRNWSIQCKRYKSASLSDLKEAVDIILEKNDIVPDVLLLVVSCDLRKDVIESYMNYAVENSVKQPLIWTASILEATLYNSRKDLLFAYFGIDTSRVTRTKESRIVRGLAMKRKLRRELLKSSQDVDWDRAREWPDEKFIYGSIIIRSIDDDTYPEIETDQVGISSWFKVNVWDFYHNGISVIVGSPSAIIDKEGNWALTGYTHENQDEKLTQFPTLMLGLIPFRNIVDLDCLGDEYQQEPHLFCRFAEGGEPYERYSYLNRTGEYSYELDPKAQFELKIED